MHSSSFVRPVAVALFVRCWRHSRDTYCTFYIQTYSGPEQMPSHRLNVLNAKEWVLWTFACCIEFSWWATVLPSFVFTFQLISVACLHRLHLWIILSDVYVICLLQPPSVWPHLFCAAGHEKRRGEQLKWSLAFTLYIRSFPCAQLPGPVHTAQLGRVFLYLAQVCILCVCIALICLCVPILLCFHGQLSHLPYRFWRWHN